MKKKKEFILSRFLVSGEKGFSLNERQDYLESEN